ncbi:hypothetical protein CDAR_175241 [Caerostris darwini]|uniref:Uncharacterized protein n=1 Tax=Caerostris darwini TaxID=1538125 RepID=A0AAV4W284_9ARAC|nr:hypothetical protein CDAR_175241 [Caerostris darwini]
MEKDVQHRREKEKKNNSNGGKTVSSMNRKHCGKSFVLSKALGDNQTTSETTSLLHSGNRNSLGNSAQKEQWLTVFFPHHTMIKVPLFTPGLGKQD